MMIMMMIVMIVAGGRQLAAAAAAAGCGMRHQPRVDDLAGGFSARVVGEERAEYGGLIIWNVWCIELDNPISIERAAKSITRERTRPTEHFRCSFFSYCFLRHVVRD